MVRRLVLTLMITLFMATVLLGESSGTNNGAKKGTVSKKESVKKKNVNKSKKKRVKTTSLKRDIKKIKTKAKVVRKSYKQIQKTYNVNAVDVNIVKKNFVSEVLADENGKVISGENQDYVHPIASLTKMMTALITIEKIEKGEIDANDPVYVSKEAVRLGGSISGIRYNETVTIEDLLKSAIVKSGNDSAYLLGKTVGGTEINFINMMNARAVELGMTNTKFYSSSGLPPYYYDKAGIYAGDRQYDVSTAADMAKLAAEIIKHQAYLDIASQYYTTIKNGKVTLRNHNQLVSKYDCIDGLKTGYHNIGHYNIAVSAKKDGVRLIAVVFGAPSLAARENEVIKLLDAGYQSLGYSGLTKHTAMDYNKVR